MPQSRRNDPYRSQTKPPGNPQCPKCFAVNVKGGWFPTEEPKSLTRRPLMCPACMKQEHHYALGVLEINSTQHGKEWAEKKEQIISTLQKTEKIVRNRNDQSRILSIEEARNKLKVYVTLPELARHLGREIEKTFKGFIQYIRTKEEPFLRVHWWSDLPLLKHRTFAPRSFKTSIDQLESTNSVRRSRGFRRRGAA